MKSDVIVVQNSQMLILHFIMWRSWVQLYTMTSGLKRILDKPSTMKKKTFQKILVFLWLDKLICASYFYTHDSHIKELSVSIVSLQFSIFKWFSHDILLVVVLSLASGFYMEGNCNARKTSVIFFTCLFFRSAAVAVCAFKRL